MQARLLRNNQIRSRTCKCFCWILFSKIYKILYNINYFVINHQLFRGVKKNNGTSVMRTR